MKKMIKKLTAVAVALAVALGMMGISANEAAAKSSKVYNSTLGYKISYCLDDFTVTQSQNMDSFCLKGQDLTKEIPISVSIEKTSESANTVIQGAKLQSKQDVAISKSTFGKAGLASQTVTYNTTGDARGTCVNTVIAVQGKASVYIVTITQGTKISNETSADIEEMTGSFEEVSTTSVTSLYKAKLKQLKKKAKYKKGISAVQIKCGKGSKVLVVTPSKNIFSDGATTSVEVYQAVKGKVKYIGKISSGGTAYPIAFTKNAILAGGNHFAGKFVVKNGTATYTVISNYMMSGKPVLKKYTVKNGKLTCTSTKKITKKKAKKDYYYCNAKGKCKGEVIGFE